MDMFLDLPKFPIIVIAVFIVVTQVFAWTRDNTVIEQFKPTERDIAVTAAATLDILFVAIVTIIWIW